MNEIYEFNQRFQAESESTTVMEKLSRTKKWSGVDKISLK